MVLSEVESISQMTRIVELETSDRQRITADSRRG